jgi:DMSO reductase iron-sulfur subunit
MPQRLPGAGEQYRFHFDMTKCIGCKCCVVACNEQNGNPADIHWRRVGEIEGGAYPDAMRMYLSMGCNHCVEPTCLTGCPVDAYSKDPLTGIVLHSAERCIGCQYCTWNCSYGVPQYNPERGVVGKCDMCYGRLAENRMPACVDACPEEAIRVEIVNIAEWRADYATANAPGLPSADDSVSTTRITLPQRLPREIKKADSFRLRPEHPHWPLVVMTTLTQISVGALCAIIAEHLQSAAAASGALFIAMIALAASTLHLGRPAYAWRALRMWRRSWLSREVLLFSLFAGFGTAYAGALWLHLSVSGFFGVLTALCGIPAIFASARLYTVAARPAWNSGHTFAEFYLTSIFAGSLFAALLLPGARISLSTLAGAAALVVLLQQTVKTIWLSNAEAFELRGSGRLLTTTLRPFFLFRAAGLLLLTLMLAHSRETAWEVGCAFAASLALEMVGRWLFFVSVVPKNMAASYVQEAA